MKDPNIIIIISDALRPKDLSLYGRDIEFDRYIKSIASESSVFMNNFTASNASDPSVTSLFTGNYPSTSGFIHQHPFMKKEELDKLKKNKFWLPLYLRNRGYKTLSATPLHLWFKKGFDYYMEKDDLKKGKFLDKPFIKRILLALPNWAYSFGKKLVKYRASPKFYPSNKVVDLAINKIKETSQPFFLFIHFVDSHYPYPIAKIKKIKGEKKLERILKNIEYLKQKEYIKKRFFDISADCIEQIERKRDESIVAVDKAIWRLYNFLESKNILDNTIFVILSDHGDSFGEHNIYFCRGGLYDSSVHVPLIMRLPGLKPKRIDELSQTIDIVPTILDILGEKKFSVDGKSLLKTIINNKKIRDSVTLVDSFCEDRFAIRTKSKKLVLTKGGKKCLLCGAVHHKDNHEEYDLKNDPKELNNTYHKKGDLDRFVNE